MSNIIIYQLHRFTLVHHQCRSLLQTDGLSLNPPACQRPYLELEQGKVWKSSENGSNVSRGHEYWGGGQDCPASSHLWLYRRSLFGRRLHHVLQVNLLKPHSCWRCHPLICQFMFRKKPNEKEDPAAKEGEKKKEEEPKPKDKKLKKKDWMQFQIDFCPPWFVSKANLRHWQYHMWSSQ